MMWWKRTKADFPCQFLEIQDWSRDDGRARESDLWATMRVMLKFTRDELAENEHGKMQCT